MNYTLKMPPLDGVRIVDLGGALAGPLAAMLLTDQGADTIRIHNPAKPSDAPVNAVLDRGKQRLILDLKSTEGRERLYELLRDADILIENYAPGVLDRLGLGSDDLRTGFPNLILVSLPGFSSSDKTFADIKAYEGVIAAVTGQYTDIHAVRGLFGLDPVFTALPLASVYGAIHAATAAVLALRSRSQDSPAPHIEAPLASAALSAMSSMYMRIEKQPERYAVPRLPIVIKNVILPALRRLAKSGGDMFQQKLLGIARKSYPALMTSYPCSDGKLLYIFAIDNVKLTRRILKELNLLDRALEEGLVFADPYGDGKKNNLSETSNLSSSWQAKLKEWVAARLMTATASHWEEHLGAAGITCAVQRTSQDWLDISELHEAGIVVQVNDPEFGPMDQPGLQAWLSDTPATFAHPRPRNIGDNKARGFWSTERSCSSAAHNDAAPKGDLRAPLKGITVIDMCSMVAGPVAGRTLAEYGARVIKVETPLPNHGPRMTCWYGVDGNQGKESMLLDLKTDTGFAAFSELLAKADILLTNHMPAAMDGMGLSEHAVRTINPAILYCRLNAYNGPLAGPWASRPGYDPVLQAAAGIMMRYGDSGHPELHAIASCVDALTGYSAAFGMALGLYRKAGDEAGRNIDVSLAGAATLVQLPFAFSHETRTGKEPQGQLTKGGGPFYRLYGAKDGWLFLAAPDAHTQDLPKALRPNKWNLSDDSLAARLTAQIKSMRVEKAVRILKASGLSAVVVTDIASLIPELLKVDARATMRLVRRDVPGLGPVISVPALQTRWDGKALALLSPAEKPGASTINILTELGLDAGEMIKTGAAAQEISDDYLPG